MVGVDFANVKTQQRKASEDGIGGHSTKKVWEETVYLFSCVCVIPYYTCIAVKSHTFMALVVLLF